MGNTDSGRPLGRERKIAEVLRDVHRDDVTGIVSLASPAEGVHVRLRDLDNKVLYTRTLKP